MPEGVKNLKASFAHAWRGVFGVLVKEPAFRIMLFFSVLVVSAVLFFDLTKTEIVVLFFLVFAVLALEIINSLFEKLLDVVKPEYDERVRIIKDLMAGLVLVASVGSAVIGAVVLFPYFLDLIF